jgi:AraC family transcriptional regulator of adaptative response/methylated-DNA-[protein]-cysteine methyltransferase
MMTNRYSQEAADYQRVEQVIRYLEGRFQEQPSLEEMAEHVHLSPYHFQRLFKRWAGISPTQFMHYLTVAYAKERLREAASVLEATLEAGVSSPGRLHDLFVTHEAVTPGEYKRQGAGLEMAYGVHDTPFGPALLATTQRGINALRFVDENGEEAAVDSLADDWPGARLREDRGETGPLVARIFGGADDAGARPFHLLLRGTNFQVQVWRALLAIPPGAMVSYGAVAGHVGRPTASRAVANAVASNPVAYLIPCHRVIRASGAVHGYRWGPARKRAMLGWEAGRRGEPALAPP